MKEKKNPDTCAKCQFNGTYSKQATCKLAECFEQPPNPIKPKKPKEAQ